VRFGVMERVRHGGSWKRHFSVTLRDWQRGQRIIRWDWSINSCRLGIRDADAGNEPDSSLCRIDPWHTEAL
jgi:hypothetical protein